MPWVDVFEVLAQHPEASSRSDKTTEMFVWHKELLGVENSWFLCTPCKEEQRTDARP